MMKTIPLSNLVLLDMKSLTGLLEKDVKDILAWAKQLENVDLTPLLKQDDRKDKNLQNVHRPRDIKNTPEQACDRDALLDNASQKQKNFFVVPKIL